MNTTKDAVEKARQILVDAITRRTEVDHVTSKVIYMKYLARLGELEIREHRLRYREQALSGKLQLMKDFVQQGMPIYLPRIQEELNMLLGAYRSYIDGMTELWKKSMRQYRYEQEITREREENKQKYRDIVERISPDIHPGISEERKKLFQQGELAYRQGDTLRLSVFHGMVLQLDPWPDPPSEFALQQELLRLEEREREVRAWTHLRTSGFPFEYENLVEDEEAIALRMEESRERIRKYEKSVIRLQIAVREFLQENPVTGEDPFAE